MSDLELEFQSLGLAISKSIRQQSRSVTNRIHSIVADSAYVLRVQSAFGLPLVSNDRCGRWYIPPDHLKQSVYFKSTDGHTGEWGFSLRRLNLQLIEVVGENGGAIIVDSTRRGKRMPDALSKTIPIWCAVVNCVLYGGQEGSEKEFQDVLYTPPHAVSRSEHAQILAKIPQWATQLAEMPLDFGSLRSSLKGLPLRPIWVTPDDYLPESPPQYDEFVPVVLCTASRMVQDGTDHCQGYIYVQGAADDHELWAQKLTPGILWDNVDDLMTHEGDEATLAKIENYAKNHDSTNGKAGSIGPAGESAVVRVGNTNVWIGSSRAHSSNYTKIVDLTSSQSQTAATDNDGDGIAFSYPLESGKKGSRELRIALPQIMQKLALNAEDRVLVLCDTGIDFSVGVALTILTRFYHLDGTFGPHKSIDKPRIKKALATIVASHPPANPSRATLNAVNSFLLG